MTRWAILTGEYPPAPGGVSDYTRLVAEGLAAAGDHVAVYAPPRDHGDRPESSAVIARRLPDAFGPRGLRWLDRELAAARPDRILIQYVPHAFGMKAMNLPFAAWVALRGSRVAPIWVMWHEVAFPFVRRPLRHNMLAVANRVMAWAIARNAERLLISIPSWEPLLRGICPGARPAEWLPVPCVLETAAAPESVEAIRSLHAPAAGVRLVGHFGTFGRLITDLLGPSVATLLCADPRIRIVLIGRGSDQYRARFEAEHAEFSGRVIGTGELPPALVAAHLRACDLLIQPYPDGVSSRRTSVMAALANGMPVVTNLGALSEPLWASSEAIAAVNSSDPAAVAGRALEILALSPEARRALGERGAELYAREFTLERTIARLRQPAPARSVADRLCAVEGH